MPLNHYGILKGRPVARRLAAAHSNHYQLHLVARTQDYRVAINVRSEFAPVDLEYWVDEDFQHPITEALTRLGFGFKPLQARPNSLALDYIRDNLLDRTRMKPLPYAAPGPDNDLNEKIDKFIQWAMADERAYVCVYGDRWGPDLYQKDAIFGFLPGNGLHNVHMNQGNVRGYRDDDLPWQDGGLFVYLPSEQRWIAAFFKFQAQSWHTDDHTGHGLRLPPQPDNPPIPGEPDLTVRIVAAVPGRLPGKDSLILLNPSPQPVDLTGWAIGDRLQNRQFLSGILPAGEPATYPLVPPLQLWAQGGIFSLLNPHGIKIHGVAYSAKQTRRSGWTLVF